jgi:hypothetical protein
MTFREALRLAVFLLQINTEKLVKISYCKGGSMYNIIRHNDPNPKKIKLNFIASVSLFLIFSTSSKLVMRLCLICFFTSSKLSS